MPKGHFPRGRGAGGHLPYLLYIRHFKDEQETGSSSTSWQARASLETIPERIAIYISAPVSFAFLSDELYLLSVFLIGRKPPVNFGNQRNLQINQSSAGR